jgi:hypothetical protein
VREIRRPSKPGVRSCVGNAPEPELRKPRVVRNVQSGGPVLLSRHSGRGLLESDFMPNPKVRIFRFLIWALLMCIACLITADFQPHTVVFVAGLFLVLFVPMVLIPIHNKRQGEQPDHTIGNESHV